MGWKIVVYALWLVAYFHPMWQVGTWMLLLHGVSSSLTSMVYPLSLFLVGLVTYPEPTRKYIVGISRYAEVLIVVKVLFQLPMFCIKTFQDIESTETRIAYAFNDQPSCPPLRGVSQWDVALSTPGLIGIRKAETTVIGFVFLDLALLVSLHFYRWASRRKGTWRSSYASPPVSSDDDDDDDSSAVLYVGEVSDADIESA